MTKLSQFHDGDDSSTATVKSRLIVHLRHMVREQVIAVGDRLPTTRELSKIWGADVSTIHYAMKELVRDGLIERVAGRGTFVRAQVTGPTRIGLYVSSEGLQAAHVTFGSQLTHEIRMALRERGLEEVTILDTRPSDERCEPWPDLIEQAKAGSIHAAIHLCSGVDIDRLRSQVSVPCICGSTDPAHRYTQYEETIRLACEHLKRCGCRAVGVIQEHSIPDWEPVITGLAASNGLRWRPEWYQHPDLYGVRTDAAVRAEHFGYHAFRQLWKQDDRPDGLVALFDHPSRGVLMAIGEADVRVPRELELVLYRNEGINYLCPYPAAVVEVKIGKLAKQFVDKVQMEIAGKPCPSPAVHTVLELVTAQDEMLKNKHFQMMAVV